MAIGYNRLGAAAYTSAPKSAIVQQATRNWQFYQKAITELDDNKGKMLKEYKESGVWKENYKSWAAACVPLSISSRRADELILIERAGESATPSGPPLGTADTTDKKESEALKQVEKAREAPAAPREEEPEPPRVKTATEVLSEDVAKNGHVEPKAAPSENGKPATKPQPITDTTGYEIPKPLLATWQRRDEVQELMSLASKLKCAVEKLQGDPLFGGLFNSQIHVSSLATIHFQLSQCKPGVICPECNGTFKDDMGRECKTCRLTGFISEHDWHHNWQKSNGSHQKAIVTERASGS